MSPSRRKGHRLAREPHFASAPLIRPHRLSSRHSALDGVSRFQIEHGLFGDGVDLAAAAGREKVEPGARFVAERAPEIA
jgi:hypothetical protein